MRIVVRPQTPRGTSPELYAAVRRAVLRFSGHSAVTPGWFDQLTGYAVPYTLTEQGPLIARGIPALTLTAGPAEPPGGGFEAIHTTQLGTVGTTLVNLLSELDAAPSIDPGGPPAIFLGGSELRGRLSQYMLVLLLVPALACVLDAAARCRRRGLPLAPGLAAFGWRLTTWLVGAVALWLVHLLPGNVASGVAVPPLPGRSGLSTLGLVIVAVVSFAYWWMVVRRRIAPREAVGGADRTVGLVGCWLGLGFASLLLCAVNPFAVILVLPAAHTWLLVPWAARRGRRTLLAVAAAGLLGPLLVLIELGVGQDLGLGAPRAVLAMAATGYLSPAVTVCLAAAGAAATQLAALASGRYAPAHPPNRLYN
jgi:hypothetical protein